MNVTKELFYTLTDAWRAADLVARLQEWWYVVRRPGLMDSPRPEPDTSCTDVYAHRGAVT